MGGDIDLVREAELLSYDLVHRPVLEPLRRMARLAADLMDVRMAEINAISHGHTVHLATSDGHSGEVPVEHSFCSRTVLQAESTMVVHDAASHPEFASSPHVDGRVGSISFYAGTRLVTPRGITIGTMCVWHDQPHDFTAEQRRTLEGLADVVTSILEVHRDSLAAARSLQRLVSSHREISASNESLEAFAGQVGHDLRTPLSALRVALVMLSDLEGVRADPVGVDLTRRALSVASRMEDGLNDLIDFAMVGGGLTPEKVEVAEVTRAVLEDLAAVTSAGTVEVDEASLPSVLAYRTHVHAIVQNLLGNALKYARPAPDGVVARVSGSVTGGWGRVVVSDAGTGVPRQLRSRVFDLSVRGEHPDHDGHGIGLATCSRLVRVMGGTIGVEDTPGGGASFWFELPLP